MIRTIELSLCLSLTWSAIFVRWNVQFKWQTIDNFVNKAFFAVAATGPLLFWSMIGAIANLIIIFAILHHTSA